MGQLRLPQTGKGSQPSFSSLSIRHLYLHLRKKDDVLTNLACGLLVFMTLGFFLSCRRFSVALRMVGDWGMGIWGFTLKLKTQLDLYGARIQAVGNQRSGLG